MRTRRIMLAVAGLAAATLAWPAPYAHTYRTTYRWDAAKGAFVGHGDLDKLDKLNEGRL